jgi:uncharacterized protein YbjT (DUF2867 family)
VAACRLLLLGSTGLVGGHVLRLALDDVRIGRIIAPTRRPLAPAARLENPVIDFSHLPADEAWWTADAVVCALGATIRAAGSQEAFVKVDRDYVMTIAQLTRLRGARAFALTSAVGANPRSRIFYNRVKGEVEAAVEACGFPVTDDRPSRVHRRRPPRAPAAGARGSAGRARPRSPASPPVARQSGGTHRSRAA